LDILLLYLLALKSLTSFVWLPIGLATVPVVFGCLFAKTFRVSQIFLHTNSLKVVVITDFMLFKSVFICLMVVMIYLAFWTIFARSTPTYVLDATDPTLQYLNCKYPSSGDWIWEIVILGIEVLWLFFGVALAYKIRKVSLLRFNESAHIALAIYNLLFLGVVIIPIIYIIDASDPNVIFILLSVGLLLGVSGMLVLLFMPKFYAIIKRKEDKDSASLDLTPSLTSTAHRSTSEPEVHTAEHGINSEAGSVQSNSSDEDDVTHSL